MKKLFSICAAAVFAAATQANAALFINEIHYDNTSTDEGEFIEVVATAGEDVSTAEIYLYNGSDSEVYTAGGVPVAGFDLFNVGTDFTSHGILADGNAYYSLMLPSNGLQNGAPDGIALALNGTLVEFLSYEGTFTGSGSIADGVLSIDIGVEQTSATPVGSSVQRIDFGSTWVATDGSNTKGGINVPEPATLALFGMGAIALIRRRR